MSYKLENHFFGYSDDPYGGHGIYFTISKDGKRIWESYWEEGQDFFTPQGLSDMRTAIKEAADKLGIKIDTSNVDRDDWHVQE